MLFPASHLHGIAGHQKQLSLFQSKPSAAGDCDHRWLFRDQAFTTTHSHVIQTSIVETANQKMSQPGMAETFPGGQSG
jgi:hypothetical protein